MRILQRNLKRTTDTFLFISHTRNVLLFKCRYNIFIGVRIIKEMPSSVSSGTPCIIILWDHHRNCRPSLTKTSLCGAWLYAHIKTLCNYVPKNPVKTHFCCRGGISKTPNKTERKFPFRVPCR